MKKDTSMNKLLPCRKRKSTGKLNHFEDASMIRKSHASLGVMARVTSKRKLDIRTALDHQNGDNTQNATFEPLHRSSNMDRPSHVDANLLHRFFGPSTFDLPPSLPKRFGSIENTRISLPVTSNQMCHNARFATSIAQDGGERNAPQPVRSLREHNPFWDYSSRVDLPPSYQRHDSVSAQLSKMCLSRSNSNKMLCAKAPPLSLPFQQAIEIRPGVVAKVRSAQETWSCLKRDFYQASACKACKTELTCIQDLDFVLCPSCGQLTSLTLGGGGGVGLGFTFSDLRRWELETQSLLK